MKWEGGKASGLDGIAVEILKYDDVCTVGCLVRIFYRRMETGVVSDDCIAPVIKREEIEVYVQRITIYSAPMRLYGTVSIKRVAERKRTKRVLQLVEVGHWGGCERRTGYLEKNKGHCITIVMQTVLYDPETWSLSAQEK